MKSFNDVQFLVLVYFRQWFHSRGDSVGQIIYNEGTLSEPSTAALLILKVSVGRKHLHTVYSEADVGKLHPRVHVQPDKL